MKSVSGVITYFVVAFLLSAAMICWPQSAGNPLQPPNSSAPDIDAIIGQIRQVTQAATVDLNRLQISRWKGDNAQKQNMQQVADSLKKNLTYAVPDLIAEVQSSRGSLSSTFRLYHNLNVVYEFLNSIAEAADAYGKREEYAPLSGDVDSLDHARQDLSTYIEKTAAWLERPTPAPTPVATPTPKKIIVDEEPPAKKAANTRKKKTSSATPSPTPTPH